MGIEEDNIFIDKKSGADFNRPSFRKLARTIKKDDLLYIKSIDRLGRNYEEIQKEWRILTKEKGADICIIDMPLLDTRRGKDLVGTFLADIVLQVLSFVAENERANIKKRQAEGIAAAKSRGIKFGRPRSPLPKKFYRIAKKWKSGEISCSAAAKECNMPITSFLYRAKRYVAQGKEWNYKKSVHFCNIVIADFL